MATGRVLQFDHARGYGFVAADDGGEDIFLHASVFDGDPEELVPGTKMAFNVMAGDRGRKAFAAHLIDDEPDNDLVPPPRPVSPPQLVAPQSVPAQSVPAQSVPAPRLGPAVPQVSSSGPAPSSPSVEASIVPTPHAPGKDQAPDDELMCDALSPAEFMQELTELLLSNVPSLTGQQVLEVRQSVLQSAKKHGWVVM